MPDRPADASTQLFSDDVLAGRVAVVSGFGTGLGRAVALQLAAMGATVVGCGRRQELLDQTVELIRQRGGTADARALDIRDDEAVYGFTDFVIEKYGRIDALVNNAGGQFVAKAEDVSPKGFRTVAELNLVGTWMMTHAAATKAFIPQRYGRIISITVSPHNGYLGMITTGTTRAGIENMMRALSLEWGRYGISTVAVAAGPFLTDVMLTKYPKDMVQSLDEGTTLGRAGRPEELANFIGFLATPHAAYITGTVLTMDGGVDNGASTYPRWVESRDNDFRQKQSGRLLEARNG